MNHFEGKKILLGVTGSIAAYKAILIIRELQKRGAIVKVILTKGAERFISSLTFFSISQNTVYNDLWSETEQWSQHVKLGEWADLFIIAPCTANTLAKIANGFCDNMLTAVFLTSRCPIWIAPAMDHEMYLNPSVIENRNKLSERNIKIIEAELGYLASGITGKGRMAEPDDIVQQIELYFLNGNKCSGLNLKDKKILITAGPTQEKLDPVRFISNYSTGSMGIALANAAHQLGGDVRLLLGPTHLPVPTFINTIHFTSAHDAFSLVKEFSIEADIIIMTAAIADFTPQKYSHKKIKKSKDQTDNELILPLKKTDDILAYVGRQKKENSFKNQLIIGFALETNDELENAKQKLISKNADYIVLNSLRNEGSGFAVPTNQVTIISKMGLIFELPIAPKSEIAFSILKVILENQDKISQI